MNINPFSDNADETSFEQGMPIAQTAKNAANSTAKTVTTQTDKQVQDAINQVLYGPSTPPGEDKGTDEANPQATDHSSGSQAANKQGGNTSTQNSNQTPEEHAKMEKIRHELFGSYALTFKSAQNGAQNIVTNVDMEMERERKQREQKEMQKKRDEEEEEQQKKQQEEEEQQEQFAMPAGKKTGMHMGRKQQEPVALRLATTKTESNRGATG